MPGEAQKIITAISAKETKDGKAQEFARHTHHGLKEIHSAERQLSRVLPKLAKRTQSEPLRAKLEERMEQGTMLIEGLDRALEEMESPRRVPRTSRWKA
jgi:ferritin-like metal-binding protein YciE